MNDPLPPPPVPVDCDLTGFNFMPLDCIRLVQSDLTAISTGDEFKAAVVLWCRAWSNVPAGSWTDDDRVLAHAAGLAIPKWKKVKPVAMRGWFKASDGRLYHPVVSQKAAEAWSHRERQRDRARKGNEVRWGSPEDRQRITEGSPPRSMDDRKGQGQGQGQGQGGGRESGQPDSQPPAPPGQIPDSKTENREALRKTLARAGLRATSGPDGTIAEWTLVLTGPDWEEYPNVRDRLAAVRYVIARARRDGRQIAYAREAVEPLRDWRRDHPPVPAKAEQQAGEGAGA